MADVQVENIVVSFTLAPSFDLPKLASILPDAKYTPSEVPVMVLTFLKPRSMVTLFPTGNVVVTGPKSMPEVHEVVKMLSDRLMVVGVQAGATPEVKIQNVTASTDLHRPLNMELLVKSFPAAEYNPSVFPGLVYKGEDQNTVILLFGSGKIVCNGLTVEDITIALDKLMEKMLSFGI
jgi:transcription initiation factor TFIID TATA-box-binding protein